MFFLLQGWQHRKGVIDDISKLQHSTSFGLRQSEKISKDVCEKMMSDKTAKRPL